MFLVFTCNRLDRQTDRQTRRQTDRHAGRHTHSLSVCVLAAEVVREQRTYRDEDDDKMVVEPPVDRARVPSPDAAARAPSPSLAAQPTLPQRCLLPAAARLHHRSQLDSLGSCVLEQRLLPTGLFFLGVRRPSTPRKNSPVARRRAHEYMRGACRGSCTGGAAPRETPAFYMIMSACGAARARELDGVWTTHVER